METAIELTRGVREAILRGACPQGAAVAGDLVLEGEAALTELPRALTVHGTLRIAGCHRLRRLPVGLAADSIHIENCAVLEGVAPATGAELRVRRDLTFSRCPSLARFPDQITVGGSLSIADCPQAWAQPNGQPGGPPYGLKAGGDVSLQRCAALRHLPTRMLVGGSLNIAECHSLSSVGEAWLGAAPMPEVGAVWITSCHGLRRVGGLAFAQDGELDVEDCVALEAVADDVGPLHTLALKGCPSLKRLPRGLPPDGWLSARDCPLLEPPPEPAVRAALETSGTTPRWAPASAGRRPRPPSP